MLWNKERENILSHLNELERYLCGETSDIELAHNSNNSKYKPIEDKIIAIASRIQNQRTLDLKVYGEIMLVCEKFADGYTDDRITLKSTDHRINYIADSINAMVSKIHEASNQTLIVLREYQEGNYLNKLETELFRGGNILDLLLNVNQLNDTIVQMLKENQSNGHILDENAAHLLENVQRLNASSNEAAASIEETAASIEEITSNVKSTTENIGRMSGFMTQVTTSLEHGEGLSHQTVKAMDEINTEVEAIRTAITVIDQIAFQTNVLSLNAAVEAATAGDAGKGFAVVAQEVRNLANRSAEAAKSIKHIVENATQRANHGKTISKSMIEGFETLNQNIAHSVGLVSDIEHAAKEQYLGIQQINLAVNQLDNQTQLNAMIANQTHDIAQATEDIARVIQENVKSKKF